MSEFCPLGRNERYAVRSDDGPLVKRLRRRPLTPQTWVRFPYGSPKNFPLTFREKRL